MAIPPSAELKLPRELPAATVVTATDMLVGDNGVVVQKVTPPQIVDAAIPLASQVEAEAGVDNNKRMTPLRVSQAISFQAVASATLAADTGATLVGAVGGLTVQAEIDNLKQADIDLQDGVDGAISDASTALLTANAASASVGSVAGIANDALAAVSALADNDGADGVGYSQDVAFDNGTVGKTLSRILYATDAPYNVTASDTVGADNYAGLMAALATDRKVVIDEPGTYLVNQTVEINRDQHLHLGDGVFITTPDAADYPAVRIVANFACLTGSGRNSGFITNAATGQGIDPTKWGIVQVGPRSMTHATNINFFTVKGFTIKGSTDRYQASRVSPFPTAIDADKGLVLTNSSMFFLSGSNFNGRFSDLYFEALGTAIHVGRVCQLQAFADMTFYRISDNIVYQEGVTENSFANFAVHQSAGVTVVKLRTTPDPDPNGFDYAGRFSYGNSFTNIMAEPGATAPSGRLTRYYDYDAGCYGNFLQGYGNTGHVGIDLNGQNVFINSGLAYFGRDTQILNGTVNTLKGDTSTFTTSYGLERPALVGTGVIARDNTTLWEFNDRTKSRAVISGAGLQSTAAYRSGGYFEIEVMGYSAASPRVEYIGKWLVHFFNFAASDPRQTVTPIITPAGVTLTTSPATEELLLDFASWAGTQAASFATISVRAVGTTKAPSVTMVTP